MKAEPLTESYFYILLCLYQNPNHGYGIMLETEKFSHGRVKIGSGTMYGAISNMIKKNWITEIRSEDPADYRKRLYQITKTGIQIFLQEKERLQELVDNAASVMNRGMNH